jgi:hypothetical protein
VGANIHGQRHRRNSDSTHLDGSSPRIGASTIDT